MSHPFVLTTLSQAVLSDDRRHRYWLARRWDANRPILVVCMFNPSTADEQANDPTIRRLLHFAREWGYGGILVINLLSLRSSSPAEVRAHGRDAVGDAQPQAWAHALQLAADQKTPVLVAWGKLPSGDEVRPFLLASGGLELVCLGTTGDGSPKHPMARGKHRIPDNQRPVVWRS